MMLAALMLTLLAPTLQAPSAQELAARKAKKLESPFLKAAPWMLDYEAALKKAAERKAPILAYFTRSYAP